APRRSSPPPGARRPAAVRATRNPRDVCERATTRQSCHACRTTSPLWRWRANVTFWQSGASRARRVSSAARCRGDEIDDRASDLLAAVFLQKMAGTLDGRVPAAVRARDVGLEDPVGAGGDRVRIAESSQERLVPAVEEPPSPP